MSRTTITETLTRMSSRHLPCLRIIILKDQLQGVSCQCMYIIYVAQVLSPSFERRDLINAFLIRSKIRAKKLHMLLDVVTHTLRIMIYRLFEICYGFHYDRPESISTPLFTKKYFSKET